MIKNKITYSNFSDWKFSVVKASGSLLWTKEGQRLIDFTSGWNVTNLGWNNEEIIKAANEQSNTNSYIPMWSSCDIQEKYAEALTSSLPTQLNAVIRATGGTEANEIAIKLARAYTKRKKIIGFKDTYHGQSLTVMSIGFRPEYTKAIDPMVPKFIQLEYPYAQNKDLDEQKDALDEFAKTLEQLLSKHDVAGMILEPGMITGWGSCGIAPIGFLEKIRELTSKYGTLMILDEVI
jgi:4-aminobutyrate aminotransferase-like enzyme